MKKIFHLLGFFGFDMILWWSYQKYRILVKFGETLDFLFRAWKSKFWVHIWNYQCFFIKCAFFILGLKLDFKNSWPFFLLHFLIREGLNINLWFVMTFFLGLQDKYSVFSFIRVSNWEFSFPEQGLNLEIWNTKTHCIWADRATLIGFTVDVLFN